MDEHSRNIGLYAKEINLDVADLSTNLRESVGSSPARSMKDISGPLRTLTRLGARLLCGLPNCTGEYPGVS